MFFLSSNANNVNGRDFIQFILFKYFQLPHLDEDSQFSLAVCPLILRRMLRISVVYSKISIEKVFKSIFIIWDWLGIHFSFHLCYYIQVNQNSYLNAIIEPMH